MNENMSIKPPVRSDEENAAYNERLQKLHDEFLCFAVNEPVESRAENFIVSAGAIFHMQHLMDLGALASWIYQHKIDLMKQIYLGMLKGEITVGSHKNASRAHAMFLAAEGLADQFIGRLCMDMDVFTDTPIAQEVIDNAKL